MSVIEVNNVNLNGVSAGPRKYFGNLNRYVVWPVHSRTGRIEWVVGDTEHPLSSFDYVETIRRAPSYAEATAGLE